MKRYAALLFALVVSLSLVGAALASSSAPYSGIGTPVIDGELTTAGEWDGAHKSNFTLNADSFPIAGSLSVMNDADNLYLAVKLDATILPFDQQTVYVMPIFDFVVVGINDKIVEPGVISEGWFTKLLYDAIDYPERWFSEFSYPMSRISLMPEDKIDFYVKVHFLGPLPFAGNYYFLPGPGSDNLVEVLIASPDSAVPDETTLLEPEGLQDSTHPPTPIGTIAYATAAILLAVIGGIAASIYLLRL